LPNNIYLSKLIFINTDQQQIAFIIIHEFYAESADSRAKIIFYNLGDKIYNFDHFYIIVS